MKRLLISAALLLPGCLLPTDLVNLSKVEQTELAQVSKDISAQLENASKEECETLYKLFEGIALYLGDSKNDKTTADVFALFNKCQADLGWQKEKYAKLSDVVEAHLKGLGLEENKNVDADVRKILIQAFHDFAAGAKDRAVRLDDEA